MVKTYKTLNVCNLVTTVLAGGKEFPLEFTGGHSKPYYRAGSFTTDDSTLQEAIENDVGYGISFVLAEVFCEDNEVLTKKDSTAKRKKENRKVDGIRTRQMAIEYLEIHTGKRFPRNIELDALTVAAAELGIEFPELN